MGTEQKLEIQTNIGKDGKEYYNLNLKPKPLKNIKGLDDGNFIIVEKVFIEGYEIESKYGKIYSCKVKYDNKEPTFILNEKEHAVYKNIGGIGDGVKITLNKRSVLNKMTGMEMIVPTLSFEKV